MLPIGQNLPSFYGEPLPSSIASSDARGANPRQGGATADDIAQKRAKPSNRGTPESAVAEAPAASSAEAVQRKASTSAVAPADAASADPQLAAEIERLRDADSAVRAHEAAHIAAGGSYVRGSASYTYQTGPDGKQYAVGGEVSIDTSAEDSPAATIRKMQTVRAAALAPSDPSATDRAVAAAAAQAAASASAELREEQAESTMGASQVESATTVALEPSREATARESPEPAAAAMQGGLGNLVRTTYAAANMPWTEPTFRVAA